MATTTINVSKQTVLQLLTSGQEIHFVIPEYQRPYSWTEDEIITLFDDLWNFSIERTKPGGAKNYFLGCVVSYEENLERQIIDGQQRITSLFLLLRAVFDILEKKENKTAEVENFITKIKPALWKVSELTGREDRTCILLYSDVVSDSGNEILQDILETGYADPKAKDNYSKNYNKFLELYKEKAVANAFQMYNFIVALLNYSILLPITADDQETALTIFNTLNNRGLPLSDADIFKSHIYKQLNEEQKAVFIEKWKKLESDASMVGESIQHLFYYNMFYLRAKEKDVNTTTPGVRKYYLDKQHKRLNENVIDDLIENLHLWEVVYGKEPIEGQSWSQNVKIRKMLDCLSSYPNEFWKYPVSVFYMEHKAENDFEVVFLKFLRKLFVMLTTRYLENPTISAVKADILKLNLNIINNRHPEFYAGFDHKIIEGVDAENKEKQRTDNLIIAPHKNIVRMLLKLLAYQEEGQLDLLPHIWDIEHIFPQKWDTHYFDLDEKDANVKLEHLGNKLPLEKKLNISASNNYFNKKKSRYRDSKIAICQKLGNSNLNEWDLSSIDHNDKVVCEKVKATFDQWLKDYEPVPTSQPIKPTATPEEEAMIKMLREKGLI